MLFNISAVYASAGASVDTISVKIVSEKNIPSQIVKRMESSVSTIGEHVLLGHTISDVNAKKTSYEKIVKEVFDRVLVGYTVDQVAIVPDNTAQILVRVNPWGDIVNEVAVEYDFGGISSEAAKLIHQDMAKVDSKAEDILLGLPIDAVDWAGGVAKNEIRDIMSAEIPEYRANIEIVPGSKTIVKIMLQPQGVVVQNVSASLKSQTIPNMLLYELTVAAEKQSKMMNGLPAAFIQRHSSFFIGAMQEKLAATGAVKRYGLKVDIEINPAQQTEVLLRTDTDKYKITLEGYLDMGRLTDNTSGKLHVGRMVGGKDELFTDITFVPSDMSWSFQPGWGHRLYSSTMLGIRYDVRQKYNLLWVNQQLGHNWNIRMERVPVTGRNEVSLRYKLHDFLSAEYIINNNDRWLRLVGNL